MIWLWKREWTRCKKDMLTQLLVGMAWPLAGFILYKVWNKVLRSVLALPAAYLVRMPKELYALLGLPPGIETDSVLFYLFFPVIFLNVWMAWRGCKRAVMTVHTDEKNGNIFGMCNQMYSRRQLWMIKFVWPLVSFLCIYMVWCLLLCLLVIVGGLAQEQKAQGLRMVKGLLALGILVHGMLICLTFLYTVYKDKKRDVQILNGVSWLLFGTLALANIYKMRNLLYLLLDKLENKAALTTLKGVLGWLEKLYWLSPLSWLNPYTLQQGGNFALQAVVCAVIAAAAAFLSMLCYRRRNFYD